MSSDEEELAAARRQRALASNNASASRISTERQEEDDMRSMFPMSFGGGPSSSGAPKARDFSSLVEGLPQYHGSAAEEALEDGAGEEGALGAGLSQLSQGPGGGPEPASDSEGSSDSDADDSAALPSSHQLLFDSHARAVSAVALDDSGARLLTGSHDYWVHMFDFGGLTAEPKPFKRLEPDEGHPILALSWAPGGELFLAVTGGAQPRVFDRQGKEMARCARGDPYIRDARHTKGHLAGCTGGAWHPGDRSALATCSEDGTLRLWDAAALEQTTVVKPQLARPGRVPVTALAWGRGGGGGAQASYLAGGLGDGSVQVWDPRALAQGRSAALDLVGVPKAQMVAKQTWSVSSRPRIVVPGAHAPHSEITSLCFARDGQSLLSRSTDGTLKLWDLRAAGKGPLASFDGLPTTFSNTQCCFSPDERLLLTGVSALKEGEEGALIAFDKASFRISQRIGLEGSIIALQWHPRINQLIVGSGSRRKGRATILYDPRVSQRGALMAAARQPRANTLLDFCAPPTLAIYNPNALPLFREDLPGQRKKRGKDAELEEARRRHKPDPGSSRLAASVGAGGQLGTTGGTLLTQHVLKQQGLLRNPKDEDVRASILRHEHAQDEFSRFTAAYAKTQPQRIYAQEEETKEEEQEQ